MEKKINITELKWENGRIYKNDICNIKWYVQDDSLVDEWGKHLTEIYKAKDISEMKFTEIKTHLLDCDVDWTKIPTDTKILVSSDGKTWHHAYFAKYECNKVYTFGGGATSWSNMNMYLSLWSYAKLFPITETVN